VYAGHIAIALALRADRDAPPLWLLALAAQGPDWGDAIDHLMGPPYGDPGLSPHSLPLVAVGVLATALVAGLLAMRHGSRVERAALLGGAAYASHWPADLFTGLKPTWPGGPIVGLEWYAFPGRDLALETVVVVVGWWLWRRSLPRRGEAGLEWALLGMLLSLQLAADVVMLSKTLLV
jgi:hypothetical protein